MPVCFFNSDYDAKYGCEYEIKDGMMKIIVDYDVSDEIETIDGVRIYGSNTKFAPRDIFIVDYHSKKNYLAKQAFFSGINSVFGTPDSGTKSSFQSSIFFEHGDIEKLSLLPETPKVSKIKIFSKSILDWIGCPSLEIVKTDTSHTIKLSKEYDGTSIDINGNNIKQIKVSDDWESLRSRTDYTIAIDLTGYIELELTRRVNYDKIYEYVNELLVFMQLYCPDRFHVDKIYAMVDGVYYRFYIPLMELKAKDKRVDRSVKVNLLEFLKQCYTRIPYRNSKTYIRNIPYIVVRTSRGVEDNFLTFYRFVECFYKSNCSQSKKTFVSDAINDHYATKHNLSQEQIEKYTQEIICLRNHYVHAGYYIKNTSLRIKFEKLGRNKNPKDYTANDVDLHWIYARTKILYEIVVNIIFKDMLGYEKYQFTRHF